MRASALSFFLLPLLILLAGASVQAHALGQDARFYPDEALFSTFARHAALNGDWLLHGNLDKTPLSIYASALSMQFVAVKVKNGVLDFDIRAGEFAARLPGALASLLLIATAYALALELYRDRLVAAWTAALTAFSPFVALYGASAFTDPLMVALGMMGVLLAARGRWLASGMLLALAFASKQQAVLLIPLAILLGWARGRLTGRGLIALILPQIVGFGLLTGWDALRAQPTSLWALAAANNNPARLIYPDEALPRLQTGFTYLRDLLGTPTLVFGIAALVMVAVRRVRDRATLIDRLLLAYIAGYLLLHWLIAFNIYPRYLLLLIVPLALLSARAAGWLWAWLRIRLSAAEGLVIAAALIGSLLTGARGAGESRAQLSEDGTDYSGILDLADTLNAQSLGAVVYDHWLGWELGFYMGQWTDKRRVYYPTPEALVTDALKLNDPAPRYFVAPTGIALDPWLKALQAAGFGVERFYLKEGFQIFRLTPPSGA